MFESQEAGIKPGPPALYGVLVKIRDLINHLRRIEFKSSPDLLVSVMIETTGEGACQYEFPANGIARGSDRVIIMHEAWTDLDSIDRPNLKRRTE